MAMMPGSFGVMDVKMGWWMSTRRVRTEQVPVWHLPCQANSKRRKDLHLSHARRVNSTVTGSQGELTVLVSTYRALYGMRVQAVARSFCFRASFELSSRYSFKRQTSFSWCHQTYKRSMEFHVREVPCEKTEAKNTKDAECDSIVRLFYSFSSLGICASKANRNKY